MDKPNIDGKPSVITAITDHAQPNGDDHAARLRVYLDNPPEWFVKQANKCIGQGMPERLLSPLAASVAYECLGDAHKWREVRPIIESRLKEIR